MLSPEAQEYNATAGGAGGKFWTPFKGTCKQLLDLVQQSPEGVSVRNAVDKIEHHYHNDKSARGRISLLAKQAAIPGLILEKRGRTPYLILTGELNEREPKKDA